MRRSPEIAGSPLVEESCRKGYSPSAEGTDRHRRRLAVADRHEALKVGAEGWEVVEALEVPEEELGLEEEHRKTVVDLDRSPWVERRAAEAADLGNLSVERTEVGLAAVAGSQCTEAAATPCWID